MVSRRSLVCVLLCLLCLNLEVLKCFQYEGTNDTDQSHILTSDHTKEHSDGNSSHGNKTGHEPHGVHLASWNFKWVADPLIVTLFIVVAGLIKIGNTTRHLYVNDCL